MDISQSNLPDRWSATAFGFMAALFLLFLIVAPALRRVGTTLFIDKSGIVRLGGVVPLQKKSTRISVLRVVGWVNGGKFVIVAETSAKFSSVVEALDSMQKAGVTLAPPQRRRDEKAQ
jgi:hypothetical protein